MAVILGLAAALTYGAADFFGGLATRKTRVYTVVLISQLFGSILLIGLFPFFSGSGPTAEALWWGGWSGLAGAAGVTFFYQALAMGRMSVIAPITAVEAASVPVIFGLVTAERPSGLALAGVACALVAVALVSRTPEEDPANLAERKGLMASGLGHALAAGLGFGAFFILLSRAGADTGLWPLAGARVSSVGLLAVVALVAGSWQRPSGNSLRLIVAAGTFDVAANLFYLLATREGLLAIVAVLTSMYPATTVLLARFTLGERLDRIQLLGLAVAVAGVIAISLG